jgi:hypothetical protein
VKGAAEVRIFCVHKTDSNRLLAVIYRGKLVSDDHPDIGIVGANESIQISCEDCSRREGVWLLDPRKIRERRKAGHQLHMVPAAEVGERLL